MALRSREMLLETPLFSSCMCPSFYLEMRTLLMFSDIMLLLSNGSPRLLRDRREEEKLQAPMLLHKLPCHKKSDLNWSQTMDPKIPTSLQSLLADLFY